LNHLYNIGGCFNICGLRFGVFGGEKQQMAKSYVLYTEILSEEKPVDCIYLFDRHCTAQPMYIRENVPSAAGYYKPTDADRGSFCENGEKFSECQRFRAYLDHLKAVGLVK
jgi:hypothetical protein